MASKEEQVRKAIVCGRNENPDLSIRKLAKKLGFPPSTVHSVLNSFNTRLTTARKKGSGTKTDLRNHHKDAKVKQILRRRPDLSVRTIARKIKMSPTFVHTSKHRQGMKSFKVKTVPNRNDKQNKTAKTRARKLYREYLTKYPCVIMDDETYVLEDFTQLPGMSFYTAMQRNGVAEHFRTKKKSKFPKKYLVWQAICSCGRASKSFITTGTVNKEIYREECLRKRLLPFLRSHDVPSLFWPDLASCHYAKDVLEWYDANGVHFVPKEANPPNCPELRPIERYWALVKRELSQHKQQATTIEKFRKSWTNAAKLVTNKSAQTLMAGVNSKVRQFFMQTV